jgi:hypothetical protein
MLRTIRRIFDFVFRPVQVDRAEVRHKKYRPRCVEFVHIDKQRGAAQISFPAERMVGIRLGHQSLEVPVSSELYKRIRKGMLVSAHYQIGRFSKKTRVQYVKPHYR